MAIAMHGHDGGLMAIAMQWQNDGSLYSIRMVPCCGALSSRVLRDWLEGHALHTLPKHAMTGTPAVVAAGPLISMAAARCHVGHFHGGSGVRNSTAR